MKFVPPHACDIKGEDKNKWLCLLMIILAFASINILYYTAITDAGDTDADKFTVDGISYEPISDTAVKVVANDHYTGNIIIPSSVTHSSKDFNVTSISDHAFYESYGLASVIIPDSVTSIGNNAFAQCRHMTSAVIGNGVTTIGQCAFDWCISLESITIPDSVISISASAFYSCTSMTSVVIGDGVKIKDSAFAQCDSLTSVTIGKGVTIVGEYAFNGCVFYDFNGKTEVTDYLDLPGYCYFGKSPSKLIRHELQNVLFDEHDGPKKIEGMNIEEGRKFTLPEYTVAKKNHFFAGWSYNGRLYQAGETVIKVNGYMNFTAVWGDFRFTLDDIEYRMTSDTTVKVVGYNGTRNVSIPSSIKYLSKGYDVTSIGKNAFYRDLWIISVTIPDSITTIDDCAFFGCEYLTSVTIGKNVKFICNQAFAWCSLTSVNIPKSTIYIGEAAFNGCTFYNFDGKKELYSSELTGYSFSGGSSSKLIRNDTTMSSNENYSLITGVVE